MASGVGIRKRKKSSLEREGLRSVIYECDAYMNWARCSYPTERSRRSIIQVLNIIRKVAQRGLQRRRG
jgi:hypothetical protein